MKSFSIVVACLLICQGVSAADVRTTASPGSDECNLDKLCDRSIDGDYVTDPNDCHRYYPCEGDPVKIGDPLSCQTGEYWDETVNDCTTEPAESARCVPKCGAPRDYCINVCNDGDPYIPNPTNCSQFFICTANGGFPAACNPGEYFDGTECQADPRFCCDTCEAYCREKDVGSLIRDPNDCTGYFYCEDRGYPSLDRHGTCKEVGYAFDAAKKSCQYGTCEIYC